MVAQPWNAPAADKEFWHVLVGPGETKILSLEQLDDFFRLEVIDASTRVWQPGMTEWLPLSVVAGIDDDDDEPASAPVPVQHARPPARPPAPPPRAPAPPSRAPAPPPRPPAPPWRAQQAPQAQQPAARPQTHAQTATAWPPAPQRLPPAPARVPENLPHHDSAWPPANQAQAGAWPTQRDAWPAPQSAARPAQQQASAWPPVAQAAASAWPAAAPVGAAPRSAPAPYASPESLRPLVLAQSIAAPAPRGSRLGSFLIGLAVLGAGVVTLHRNDVFRDLAKSAGQERSFLQVERSVGSPGFGTPRAVEQLALLTPTTFTSDSMPVRSTPATAADSVRPPSAEPVAPIPASAPEPETRSAASTPSSAVAEKPEKSESKATAPSKTSLESMIAAQVSPPSKKRQAAVQRAGARERPAPTPRRESSQPEPSLGIKGSTNRFDPLNGKL